MRALLRDMPAGVPADCLLARIKGRRSFLVHDWDRLLLARHPMATLAAAPWRQNQTGSAGWARQALQQEYFWAFLRMDEQLRRDTAPFFWLAELRTLAVSLRLRVETGANPSPMFKWSLLAGNIRKALLESGSDSAAVAELEDILARRDSSFAGLTDIYRTGGPGGFEAALHEMSLRILAAIPVHPQMLRYVRLLIDSRNLVTIAKRLRWRLGTIPPLLEGGTWSRERLTELFKQRDSAGLLHLAMRLGGQARYREADDFERVLYEAQARVMRRLAREADGIGVILDYLWRCGNEAANIGLLERLETAGSAHAGAELRI